MDHFNAIENGIRWFEILFAGANEKEKQEGNPLREVTRQSYLHQPQ